MNEMTKYYCIDEVQNVWMCEACGHMAQFEADGPYENGWDVCPSCGGELPDPEEDE